MGVSVPRGFRQNARPPRRQGRGRRGDDTGGHARAPWLHDHDRGVPCVLQVRRQISEGPVGASPPRAEDPRTQRAQKARRPQGPAAGERALGRQVLHARDDGHRPQPGSERPHAGGPAGADRRRAVRARRVPPLRADVRQDREGHRRRSLRGGAEGGEGAGGGEDRPRAQPGAAARAGRRVQGHLPRAHRRGLPRGPGGAAAGGHRGGVRLVEHRPRGRLPPDGEDPRRPGHGRERPDDGVRQHGR